MPQENNKTLNDILETVNYIKENTVTKDDLKRETDKLATKEELKTDISAVKDNINDVVETVNFIKENVATKQELADSENRLINNLASKQELADSEERLNKKMSEYKNDIVNSVDGFIKLHQELKQELTALRSKYNRLEDQMKKVLAHLQLEV